MMAFSFQRPLLLAVLAAMSAGAQTRVLILSGRNNHDWRTTTPALKQLLLDSKRFDVRVNEEPAGMSAETLAGYQAVVLDYNGARWGSLAEQALADFVRSGRGLVVVHAASWAFNGLPVLADNHVRTNLIEPAWEEYRKIIGGIWSLEKPATGHAQRHRFTVKFTDREHPISKASPETFETNDELYHNMRMQPGARVLATAFDKTGNPTKSGTDGTGRDEPAIWVVEYGKGRVFHTILGHDVQAIRTPGFVTTFVRGTEWAATGAVTP